ncbi:MAG: glycosyltransferase family 2 protein [Kiritimatiellae bacterium]|nr:glycosyltransferase family 2 protein [Kiritimatiellia bacterium]
MAYFFDGLCCLFSVVFFWSTAVLVLGLLRKGRVHPEAERKLRFAVLICARDEERVIALPVKSILGSSYPRDKYEVFVLADNCTDRTADIASREGATVWRKESPSTGKGDVLAWGVDKVRKSGGFDAIAVFDADNTMSPKWLDEMNNALNDGESVVTGCRYSSNAHVNVITGWYCVYWNMMNELSNRVRTNLGLSGKLTGTGFAFLTSCLGEEGWNTRTMVEDVEFSVQGNITGRRIAYVGSADYADEQPVAIQTMWRQIRRWSTGGWQVVRLYSLPWVVAMCRKPSLRLFDSFFSILTGISVAFIHFANFVALVVKIAAGAPILPTVEMFLGFLAFVFAMGWITAVLASLLTVGKERAKILPVITFPVFSLVLSMSILFTAIFPTRQWKSIPHGV